MTGGVASAPAPARGEEVRTGAADQLLTVGEQIERVFERGEPDAPVAREQARDLVRAVTELYGAGLARVLELADAQGVLDGPLLACIAEDPLVSALLLVHGLHPLDPGERVRRALARIEGQLAEHGAVAELIDDGPADSAVGGVDSGVGGVGGADGTGGALRIRVVGGGGCASTSASLLELVRATAEDAAPDAPAVEVVAQAPKSTGSGGAGAFIPLATLTTPTTRKAVVA